MKKLAFSMIELVFVIVVIGIITAVMLPRIDRDNVYEAAQQLVSHIKYTQHLAMIDNKFDDDDTNWYQELWQIRFQNCAGATEHAYSIFSNINHDNIINVNEVALDPLSRKRLTSTTCNAGASQDPNVILSDRYNIEAIALGGACFNTGNMNQSVAFDHLGRPHFDLQNATNIAQAVCTIRISSNDDNATITIQPETGYTSISFP